MSYIDNTVDDATTYKGKIDAALNLNDVANTVVAEESFSINGDFSAIGRAKKVRVDGGYWVTVYMPIMTHTATDNPGSNIGDLPSAYRPDDIIGSTYATKLNAREIVMFPTGSFYYLYSSADVTTEKACSLTYFTTN